MKIDVLLFATLKDIAGRQSVTVTLPDDVATVDDVRNALVLLHPELEANAQAAIAAVDQEFAFAHDAVYDGAVVAFFPPVSGGDGGYPEMFRLANEPVDTNAVIAAITTPQTGAVCIFSGVVRGETNTAGGRLQTARLEYEGYEPMAVAKMRQVAQEIRARWPLVQGIAIVQRVGALDVGQNTVIIGCSCGHRDQGCFEAARYGIDRLKEIVPVWKKEIGPDGASWVEGHYRPTTNDRVDEPEQHKTR